MKKLNHDVLSRSGKEALQKARQKVIEQRDELIGKLDALRFDPHWYRRVVHTAAASLLLYYVLPAYEWVNNGKVYLVLGLLILGGIIEVLRIKGILHSKNFFGLRQYERERAGSYLYFSVAAVLLLVVFPQAIAIPCLLCACLTDPIMGEIRYRFGKTAGIIAGFFVSFILFVITWYSAGFTIMMIVSVVGACGAVIGETVKYKWIDDDFLIQMVPALVIVILMLGLIYLGVNVSLPVVLYPFGGTI